MSRTNSLVHLVIITLCCFFISECVNLVMGVRVSLVLWCTGGLGCGFGHCVWLWSCVGTVSGGCGPAVRWEGRNHPSSSPPALPQFTHENFSRKLREMFSTLLVLNCDTVSCSAICDEFLNYSQM